MSRRHAWLHEELGHWVAEGLLTSAQGERLRARYPLESSGWGRLALTGFGAVLIGLGVVLLFAYNWAEMSKFAKLGVIFGALLLVHGSGMWLRRTPDGWLAGEGMQALGTMLFGAGIWLVAQVYHIDEHYPNAFLIWGLGALALAWALPSLTQALLAVALVVVWQLCETLDFQNPLHSAPWLLLLGVFPLIWRLRSPVLAGFAVIALLLSVALSTLVEDLDVALPVLLLLGSAAVAFGQVVAGDSPLRLEQVSRGFAGPGMITYLAVLYLLTFPELVRDLLRHPPEGTLAWAYLFGTGLAAALAWGLALWGHRRGDWLERLPGLLVVAGSALVLLVSLGGVGHDGWLAAVPFNLLFLAHALWLLLAGERHLLARQVAAGGLLLILLAGARYLDLFDSLLSRSLVFFLVGGALFVAGNLYSRRLAARGAV